MSDFQFGFQVLCPCFRKNRILLFGQYEAVCGGVDFLLVHHAPMVAPGSRDDVGGEAEFANSSAFGELTSTRRKCQSCAPYCASQEHQGNIRRVP